MVINLICPPYTKPGYRNSIGYLVAVGYPSNNLGAHKLPLPILA